MNRLDPRQSKQSDAIRSEIDETRQRMDSTLDALTERLKGRHLVDELLGLLRSGDGGSAASTVNTVKTKVAETTGATVHAVVEAVKAHPLPVLVMGAGLAWLIYEKEHAARGPSESFAEYDPEPIDAPLADEPRDMLGEFPGGDRDPTAEPFASSQTTELGGEAHAAGSSEGGMKERIQETAGEAKRRVQQTASQIAAKASKLAGRAGQGVQSLKRGTAQARAVAARTSRQVAGAAREHPVETGLSCLAIGLLAGLLTPTPQRVRDEVRPVAQRLKDRAREAGRDVLARGKRVVAAANEAARHEAQQQGLTPEAMRQHVAGKARGPGDEADAGPHEPSSGDRPGQDEAASPPTPAMQAAAGDDARRPAGSESPRPPTAPTPPPM